MFLKKKEPVELHLNSPLKYKKLSGCDNMFRPLTDEYIKKECLNNEGRAFEIYWELLNISFDLFSNGIPDDGDYTEYFGRNKQLPTIQNQWVKKCDALSFKLGGKLEVSFDYYDFDCSVVLHKSYKRTDVAIIYISGELSQKIYSEAIDFSNRVRCNHDGHLCSMTTRVYEHLQKKHDDTFCVTKAGLFDGHRNADGAETILTFKELEMDFLTNITQVYGVTLAIAKKVQDTEPLSSYKIIIDEYYDCVCYAKFSGITNFSKPSCEPLKPW